MNAVMQTIPKTAFLGALLVAICACSTARVLPDKTAINKVGAIAHHGTTTWSLSQYLLPVTPQLTAPDRVKGGIASAPFEASLIDAISRRTGKRLTRLEQNGAGSLYEHAKNAGADALLETNLQIMMVTIPRSLPYPHDECNVGVAGSAKLMKIDDGAVLWALTSNGIYKLFPSGCFASPEQDGYDAFIRSAGQAAARHLISAI